LLLNRVLSFTTGTSGNAIGALPMVAHEGGNPQDFLLKE